MADSMEPCKMLWADLCCHGNEIWAWRGDPVAYRLVLCITHVDKASVYKINQVMPLSRRIYASADQALLDPFGLFSDTSLVLVC